MHRTLIPETAWLAAAIAIKITIRLTVLIAIWTPIGSAVLVTVVTPILVAILVAVLVAIGAEVLAILTLRPVSPVKAIFIPVVTEVWVVVLIVPLIPPLVLMLMLRTIIVALRLIKRTRLMRLLGWRLLIWLSHHRPVFAAKIIALIISEFVAIGIRSAHRCRTAHTGRVGIAATRAHLLFAERHDDAIVVLGVLHIVLSEHRITRRQRVTRQRHVFLGDVGGRTAKLNVRPRALEATSYRILRLAVAIIVVAIVATPAAAAILLTLPHWLPFLQV